jgi:hypothetical protein
MHKKDLYKLQAAGFTILRTDTSDKPKIKKMNQKGSWETWKNFDTKAAMNREVERVRQDEPMLVFEYDN